MTYEDLDDILRGYIHRVKLVEQLECEIEQLESRMRSPRISQLGERAARGSARNSAVESLAIRHTALLDKYTAHLESLADAQEDVVEILSVLEPRERTVMGMRYIDGMAWEDIMDETALSRSSVKRIHKMSMDKLRAAYCTGV